jgi:hypothetical protein
MDGISNWAAMSLVHREEAHTTVQPDLKSVQMPLTYLGKS